MDYHLDYVGDYYPYGKTLREYYPTWQEPYLTTQHVGAQWKFRPFGKRDEETGFDYRGARFYDGELGRFLSVDPLAADYAAWSGYNYVLGNPIRMVDPDGMRVDDWVARDDGTIEWDDNVNSAADVAEGEEYLGKEFSGISDQGNLYNFNSNGTVTEANATNLVGGPLTEVSFDVVEKQTAAAVAGAIVLSGIALDASILDPTDVAVPKWIGEAVAGAIALTAVAIGTSNHIVYSKKTGKQSDDGLSDWTNEDISSELSRLKGQLNKAQRALKRRLQGEQKARKLRNKQKRNSD